VQAVFDDTQPAALAASGDIDAWAAFRVSHPQQRLALLRQLRDSSAAVVLQAPGGRSLTTTLWALDDQRSRLSFNAVAEHPQLDALVEASEVTAIAYLEAVKLQFELQDLVLVRGKSSCSLQAPAPLELYRFQRRNAYRVRAPERLAPLASFRHPSMPDMQLALRVLDVSAGGCSMWLPQDVPPLQPGTLLGEVKVALDAETRFAATVTLQHLAALVPGSLGARLGCAWQPRGDGAARSLQRWIDQAQKRRRLLSR
jgi:c-di-GMP-binding flagellar brake protein YcgR